MKKLASLLLSGALALGLLAGCGGTPGTADTPAANTDTPAAPTQTGSLEGTTLKVGASPAPHAEILAVVKELLAEEGINLEIVEFTDYIQPNAAVENGPSASTPARPPAWRSSRTARRSACPTTPPTAAAPCCSSRSRASSPSVTALA